MGRQVTWLVVVVATLLVSSAWGAAPVTRIELLADPEIEVKLGEVVAIEVGKPLDDRAVARTLTNVVALGIASRAEVRSRADEAGGLVVTVVVLADTVVERARFAGDLGLDRRDLERHVEITRGDRLVEDRIVRSVFALEDALVAAGWRSAKVRVAVDVPPASRSAQVTWNVAAGTRTTVAAVEFEGDLAGYTPARLAELGGLEIGKPARSDTVEAFPENLVEQLIALGHPSATVEVLEELVEGTALTLRARIAVGPTLEVVVDGAKLSDLERRDLLPFGAEAWDPSLVDDAVAAIREDYQRRGFWQARVEAQTTTEAGKIRVHLTVVPGPEWRVREVRFEGGESVQDEVLRRLVATTARRALVPGSGRLVDSELVADRANVLSYYRLEGYLDAEVAKALVVPDPASGTLEVVFAIVEGPRRRIVRLEIVGFEVCAQELPSLQVNAGGAWHPLRLEESGATLAAACERAGYPDVIVRREESWNDAKTLVDVRFEIDAGSRVVVDRVILQGLRRSEPSWVRRASGLEPGTPLSREELLAAERRLFRLGVFSEVDVEPSARTQDGSRRDIVVRLREGRTQRVTYGVGYDSEDGLGALVGYSHGHVAGRGYQLQIDGRASESTHRFRLIARRPELGRRQPFAAAFTAFADQEERPGFTVERQGGRFELERRWRALDSSVGFDYRRVDLLELIGGSGTDADRELQDIDIASVIGQASWDGRDDPVDPTRGFSTSLVVQQAFPLFTAEEDFLKVFAQQTAQVRLGRLGVLAASLRFGGIEPNADRVIPVAERLYAGGRTTHRAFRRDRLGVPGVTLGDTGAPLGGNGLALVNVDWRFPLAAGVGGIAFVDGGNVWAKWRDANLDELRWGAGVGVRYVSPIGPLRLEVGWPFEPEPFEDEYVVSFSFGNAF